MRTLKLTIEYCGTHFSGWQIQRQGERTVQGELKKALEKTLNHAVTVIGAGRTDSGVHALGQVAHCKTFSTINGSKLLQALNANLPSDIATVHVQEVPDNFHAQYSAIAKTYRYTILNRAARCVHQADFCLFHPQPLNLALIKQEARSLVGRKDFKSFAATDAALIKKKYQKTTIRTVQKITVRASKGWVTIDITADGFLYKMVRTIVGTLLKIAEGKMPKGSIKKILASKTRCCAGPTAPAKGLCLVEVKY